MLLTIVTFRGRYRILAISKTKLLVTIVNGFHLLTITAEINPRCGMDPRSALDFSEICNGNIISFTKYKIAFSILTVISYDLVVLRLIAETRRKRIFKRFLQVPP